MGMVEVGILVTGKEMCLTSQRSEDLRRYSWSSGFLVDFRCDKLEIGRNRCCCEIEMDYCTLFSKVVIYFELNRS